MNENGIFFLSHTTQHKHNSFFLPNLSFVFFIFSHLFSHRIFCSISNLNMLDEHGQHPLVPPLTIGSPCHTLHLAQSKFTKILLEEARELQTKNHPSAGYNLQHSTKLYSLSVVCGAGADNVNSCSASFTTHSDEMITITILNPPFIIAADGANSTVRTLINNTASAATFPSSGGDAMGGEKAAISTVVSIPTSPISQSLINVHFSISPTSALTGNVTKQYVTLLHFWLLLPFHSIHQIIVLHTHLHLLSNASLSLSLSLSPPFDSPIYIFLQSNRFILLPLSYSPSAPFTRCTSNAAFFIQRRSSWSLCRS